VGEDPNPGCDTQEQNSEIDRVQPHFDNLFHRIFSLLIFAKCIVQRGELTSPKQGEQTGEFSYA
jgi:hypothetical protein